MSTPEDTRTLVDELLAEQQQLTAVDRFSQRHDAGGVPAQAKYYRDLIPTMRPQPGQQYAFEVDLDKCSGCKACVSACHSLNGLDDGESWREVGLLFSDDWRQPFQQTVTTACHHCADPGCLNGCPVLAYDKDPQTGIVRHLDDQCIGCQYCVMKCPYDVPKYSARRGIVRKCDMCSSRLAVGEAPACAQACPSEAIRITIVDFADIAKAAHQGTLLPGAPDSKLTRPSTRYKSTRPLPPGLVAGDHARIAPAEAHVPLIFMLVFTQLSAGASVASLFVEPAKWLALMAVASGGLGLAIAPLHLGRPLQAWRSFLGWRKSWFSREVIVFGLYVPLTAVTAWDLWSAGHGATVLKITTAFVGLLGIACSAMIYADTGRAFWRASQCFGKFFGTTALLGTVAALAVGAFTKPAETSLVPALAALLFMISIAKLAFEQRIFRSLVDEETPAPTPLNKTARLLAGQLGFSARSRIGLGILGGIILPLLIMMNRVSGGAFNAAPAVFALIFCGAGELMERSLFFRASAPAGMPGGVAP